MSIPQLGDTDPEKTLEWGFKREASKPIYRKETLMKTMTGLFSDALGGGEWAYLEEAANKFWNSNSGAGGKVIAFDDYIGTESDDTVVFAFDSLYRNPYKALIDLKGGNDAVEFLGASSMNQVDLGDGEINIFKANDSVHITDIYGGNGDDLFLFRNSGWGTPNVTRSTIKSRRGNDIVIIEKDPESSEASLLGVNFKLGEGNDAFLIKSSGKTFGSWDSEDLTTIYLGAGDDIFVLEQLSKGGSGAITTSRHSQENYIGADFLIDGGDGDDIIDLSSLSLESLNSHSVIIGGSGNDEIFLPSRAQIKAFVDSSFEKISVGGEVVYDKISEPYDGIIKSIEGKGKLKGTKGADAFTFDAFDIYTKKNADRIIGFNASHGDIIAVSPDAFPSIKFSSEVNYASTDSRKVLKQLSQQDYDFVYFEKNGRLYVNGNGPEKNWGNTGEGGLVAILKGKPELTAGDFTLLG